jgi:hypothetical protein
MDADFGSLVGLHELSGVDSVTLPRDDDNNWMVPAAAAISFVLDGVVYTAIEDPSDGYRSSMDSFNVGGTVNNRFAPQKVMCRLQTKSNHGQLDDLLIMTDVVTGKEVLRVGTANTNNYYPYFVSDFDPTAMACNAPSDGDKHG